MIYDEFCDKQASLAHDALDARDAVERAVSALLQADLAYHKFEQENPEYSGYEQAFHRN